MESDKDASFLSWYAVDGDTSKVGAGVKFSVNYKLSQNIISHSKNGEGTHSIICSRQQANLSGHVPH